MWNAKQTGLDKLQAVREKLADLVCYREGINAHLTAAIAMAQKSPGGLLMPHQSMLYAGRVFACSNLPQMMHIARELCGGQICVTPNEAAFKSAGSGTWLEKFYSLNDNWQSDDRRKLLAFARDLLNSDYAGHRLTFIQFAQARRHVFSAVDRRVRAELLGGVEPIIADIGGDNPRRTARARQLNMQQAGYAAADHEHGLTRGDAAEALRAHHARERLNERTFVESHAIGNAQRAELDIDLRHADVFGESTGIEMSRAQQVADRLVSRQTVTAFPAGHMVRSKNPIAGFKVFDPFPNFSHFTGNLVTQNQRRLLDPVPFHKIAAADAARAYANQQLTRVDLRNRQLFEPHVPIVVVHRHAHSLLSVGDGRDRPLRRPIA